MINTKIMYVIDNFSIFKSSFRYYILVVFSRYDNRKTIWKFY